MNSQFTLQRSHGKITSASLDGNQLLKMPEPNHFAVTRDMILGLPLKDLPEDLHLMVVKIENGKTYENPLGYCVCQHDGIHAELLYHLQCPRNLNWGCVSPAEYAMLARQIVLNLPSESGISKVGDVMGNDRKFFFTFTQTFAASTLDNVLNIADQLRNLIDTIAHSIVDSMQKEIENPRKKPRSRKNTRTKEGRS